MLELEWPSKLIRCWHSVCMRVSDLAEAFSFSYCVCVRNTWIKPYIEPSANWFGDGFFSVRVSGFADASSFLCCMCVGNIQIQPYVEPLTDTPLITVKTAVNSRVNELRFSQNIISDKWQTSTWLWAKVWQCDFRPVECLKRDVKSSG